MLEEFKNFALKGNVVDLAIGVIIGAAFGKIIDSLVKHIIMPLISLIMPGEQGYLAWKWVHERQGNSLRTVYRRNRQFFDYCSGVVYFHCQISRDDHEEEGRSTPCSDQRSGTADGNPGFTEKIGHFEEGMHCKDSFGFQSRSYRH